MAVEAEKDNDYSSWSANAWAANVPDLDPAAAELGIRFGRAASRYEAVKNRALRQFHHQGIMGFEDFRALSLLRKADYPGLSVTEIAERLEITRGAVSTRMDRFDREELIVRHADPKDRRSHTIELATHAHELVDDMYRAIHSAHEKHFAPIDKKRQALLSEILHDLLEAPR